MSEPTQSITRRLQSLSERLPGIDPDIWHELSGIITDAAKLEANIDPLAVAEMSLALQSDSLPDDREGFVGKCQDMQIDVSIDTRREFRSKETRTLWSFWCERGRRLQEGYFLAQTAECRRLKGMLTEQQQKTQQADARCRQMIDNLTQTKGFA